MPGRTRIRTAALSVVSAAAVLLMTAPPANAVVYNMYTTNNRCGTFAFDSHGEWLTLVDNCSDGLGVIGYYSKAESVNDASVQLTSGNGSYRMWNKSWPEGLLVKFKVCAYYKDGKHRFCSGYEYHRA
jgi:hypothetical protein